MAYMLPTWPTCLNHASFTIDHKPNCWGNAQERPCWDFYYTSNLLIVSARFSQSLTNMLNSLASHKTFTGLTSSVSCCVICVCACVCVWVTAPALNMQRKRKTFLKVNLITFTNTILVEWKASISTLKCNGPKSQSSTKKKFVCYSVFTLISDIKSCLSLQTH